MDTAITGTFGTEEWRETSVERGPTNVMTSLPGIIQKKNKLSSVSTTKIPDQSFSEWALSRWDFSRGCPSYTNPINTLSPFPVWPPNAFGKPLHFSRSRDLDMEEITYKIRLRNLINTLGTANPKTLNIMHTLADIMWEKGEWSTAQRLSRQAAIYKQEVRGSTQLTKLVIYLDAMQNAVFRGEYFRAKAIHEPVHAAILKLVGPEDEVALESTDIMAKIYYHLAKYEEADRLWRQLLQINLQALGLRHKQTMYHMRKLAILFRDTCQLSESEQLLRTTVYLLQEETGNSRATLFSHMRTLLDTLCKQGQPEQSVWLIKDIAQQSEAFLGSEHPGTLRSHSRTAHYIYWQGRFEESAIIFKRTLEQQVRALGAHHQESLQTIFHLAIVLQNLGRYQEAGTQFEICFKRHVERYSLEHPRSLRSCFWCGNCYKYQGRYEDAITLYQQTVDDIRKSEGDEHPFIGVFSSEINYLQGVLANYREDGLQKDVPCEVNKHSPVEGARLMNEDWMEDLFDFQRLQSEN